MYFELLFFRRERRKTTHIDIWYCIGIDTGRTETDESTYALGPCWRSIYIRIYFSMVLLVPWKPFLIVYPFNRLIRT